MIARLLALILISIGTLTPAEAQRRALTPRIEANNDVRLSDDLKIGRYQGGKFISQPGSVAIDGGTSTVLGESDALANLSIVADAPSAAWRGRSYSRRVAPGQRAHAYVGDAMILVDPGSGANGPTTAGYGKSITVIKQGFPSVLAPAGEIDGFLTFMRQSGPTPTKDSDASDANAHQGNIQMSGWPGFMAYGEELVTRIDPTSYAITHGMVLQRGLIDGFGKNGENGEANRYGSVNPLTVGYFAGANTGPLDRAFYATNANNGSKWQDFTYFGTPGVPMRRTKGLDGRERFGVDGAHFDLGLIDGALQIQGANGQTAFAAYQGGTTFANNLSAGQITVGGTTKLTGRSTIVFAPLSSTPGTPAEGETYYEAATKALRTWDGSALTPSLANAGSNEASITAGTTVAARFGTVASAVNFPRLAAAVAGSGPVISAIGSDANIPLNLAAKGTSSIQATSPLTVTGSVTASAGFIGPSIFASGSAALTFGNVRGTSLTILDAGGTIANSITMQSSPTGFGPSIAANGTDANIPLNLYSKGASPIQALTGFSATSTFSATGVASFAGNINMTGATANAMFFGSNAVGLPGTNGVKISLYGGLGTRSVGDYSIGVNFSDLWLNAPTGGAVTAKVQGTTVASFGAVATISAPLTLTGGLTAANLPTTGGTVKGTLCVDTTGLTFVKTTTGGCL